MLRRLFLCLFLLLIKYLAVNQLFKVFLRIVARPLPYVCREIK